MNEEDMKVGDNEKLDIGELKNSDSSGIMTESKKEDLNYGKENQNRLLRGNTAHSSRTTSDLRSESEGTLRVGTQSGIYRGASKERILSEDTDGRAEYLTTPKKESRSVRDRQTNKVR